MWIAGYRPLLLCGEIPTEKIELKVAESRVLTLEGGGSLRVSRHGIVDLQHIQDEKWRLTGLRKGFVIVRWQNADNETLLRQLHIKVEQLKIGGKKSGELRPHACDVKGLSCDWKKRLVTGELDSFFLWARTKKDEDSYDSWLFTYSLSSQGRKEFRDWLVHRFGSVELEFVGEVLQVGVFCKDFKSGTPSIQDSWLQELIHRDAVAFYCSNLEEQPYKIHARLIQITESKARALGLVSSFSKQGAMRIPLQSEIFADIVSKDNEQEIHSIAEPEIVLQSGSETELESGGEFKVAYEDQNSKSGVKEGWKKFGYQLSLQIDRDSDTSVFLRFAMQLRSRGLGIDVLGVNGMKSFLRMPMREPCIVGISRLDEKLEVDSSSFSMRFLPILGPLFRLYQSDFARSYIVLWIYVDTFFSWREEKKMDWEKKSN